ncbi:uncharacterized protein LOC119175065 isoform X2 [Rhipicephalus microplus]|uniref:uncharacterized protein LOC119175065 isoform X2 n=1 Tax=Rhipicephalus microplus TaxID=6941 RepID=UPI003F6BA41D
MPWQGGHRSAPGSQQTRPASRHTSQGGPTKGLPSGGATSAATRKVNVPRQGGLSQCVGCAAVMARLLTDGAQRDLTQGLPFGTVALATTRKADVPKNVAAGQPSVAVTSVTTTKVPVPSHCLAAESLRRHPLRADGLLLSARRFVVMAHLLTTRAQ